MTGILQHYANRKADRLAGLTFCTEPALAVMPTSSALRISRWSWNFHGHLCSSRRRRTSSIFSILPAISNIYEEKKEEEASWRWCSNWVVNSLLLLVVAPFVVTLVWPPVFALECIELVRYQFMPGSRSTWIAHTCSSTFASFGWCTYELSSGTQGRSLALYEEMRNFWIHIDADCKE